MFPLPDGVKPLGTSKTGPARPRRAISFFGGEHVVETVGGCKPTPKEEGGKITVTDENGTVANVTIPDVIQFSGVIHVIDAVLTPKMPRGSRQKQRCKLSPMNYDRWQTLSICTKI